VASVEAMLTTVERVLRDEGFAKLTTNRVAEVAGVNVSLVYRYFAGKEAMVGALVDRAAAQTLEAVEATLAAHRTGPLERALEALVVTLMETPGAPTLHRALVEQVERTRRGQVIDGLRRQATQRFEAFLEQRGELGGLADPEATLFVVGHALEAMTHAAAFARPGSLSRARAIAAVVRVLRLALAAQPQ
jgi:AcrR family transcriptional regulator